MQNQSSVQVQLREAYQHIKARQPAAALKILAPICKNDPTNATAWWLAAHAFSDDNHIQYALRQVLSIDPNFPRAAEKLATIQSRAIAKPRPSTIQRQPAVAKPKKASGSNFGWILTLVVILIGIAIGGAALFVLQDNNKANQASSQAVVETQTSKTPVNTRTPIPTTSVPVPPTLPPQYTATAIPPSFTPTVPRPTRTPRPTATDAPTFAAPSTANPSNFGDTYWEGTDDGSNMETYVNRRGQYLRFYRFPVLVYVINGDTQARQNAVDGALKDINQIVPIRTTEDSDEADIVLEFIPQETLQVRCETDNALVVGCGTIDYFGGGFAEPIIRGTALISTEPQFNLKSTIIHELLHALGIFSHSPNPNDIMYFQEAGVTRMSQRDINTLRRLYEGSPSFAYGQ